MQFPTDELKSILHALFSNALSIEQELAESAKAQLSALVEELYPLVQSETQALLTASNPAVPQAYLEVLKGCVAAALAKLGLEALSDQRHVIAVALQAAIQVLALVLKTAVVA
jgi:hypothetical protein